MIVLGLIGVGSALLMRQLAQTRAQVRAGQEEASRMVERDRLRGIFISSISPDLRAPLTASRAGLGMLETSITGRMREAESPPGGGAGFSVALPRPSEPVRGGKS